MIIEAPTDFNQCYMHRNHRQNRFGCRRRRRRLRRRRRWSPSGWRGWHDYGVCRWWCSRCARILLSNTHTHTHTHWAEDEGYSRSYSRHGARPTRERRLACRSASARAPNPFVRSLATAAKPPQFAIARNRNDASCTRSEQNTVSEFNSN